MVAKPPWAVAVQVPAAPIGVLLRFGGGVSVKVGVNDGVRVGLLVGSGVSVAGMSVGNKADASVDSSAVAAVLTTEVSAGVGVEGFGRGVAVTKIRSGVGRGPRLLQALTSRRRTASFNTECDLVIQRNPRPDLGLDSGILFKIRCSITYSSYRSD